ncbi:hypothetical protein F5H01DRAFT_353253 [Linnemannia elongata]|nr:hypothetical protein F5H01DRAFT_353253 [Linnemannia elongata]
MCLSVVLVSVLEASCAIHRQQKKACFTYTHFGGKCNLIHYLFAPTQRTLFCHLFFFVLKSYARSFLHKLTPPAS